ncbi:uncharacterized protein [Typha latifolia]|uniref:uncharacterized protein n=1 Tax=Typha latifolia TaxID=4733 RepID=UPI003C2CCC5E
MAMDLRSSPPIDAKKLWSYLRAIFFMMRKGIVSKRKLVMDMNLMMKRGKLLGRSLGNLMFHHHDRYYHSRSTTSPHPGFGLREYEFSCSNSPNPVFFHAKRRRNYFPCLNAVVDEAADVTPRRVVFPQIEYSPHTSSSISQELVVIASSPFSVRISNYSSEEDDDVGDHQGVDYEAEEFIKRFYEQLRAQSRIALLQYQEMEYQEMLARGA